MTQKDITLNYFGGSGGYFALHLLLLTDQYHCIFEGEEQDFKQIFQNQWNIREKWKDSEIHPDNNKTFISNIVNKLYFCCNPTLTELDKFPSKKIILYTDIETQMVLAKYKNAYLYTRPEDAVNNIIKQQFIMQYDSVRADNWPIVDQLTDFNLLSDDIKQECASIFQINNPMGYRFPSGEHDLLDCYKHNMSVLYKDDLIFNYILPFIQKADIVVKLQDLIKTNGEVLFNQLGILGNSKIKDFIDMYIQLHGVKEQKVLLEIERKT
jgi:hypothetical protein